MATVKLLSDQEAAAIPAVQAVFDDIRATRKTDFINNFWRALANDPANLKRVWETLKSVMTVEGAIDPLTRETEEILAEEHQPRAEEQQK